MFRHRRATAAARRRNVDLGADSTQRSASDVASVQRRRASTRGTCRSHSSRNWRSSVRVRGRPTRRTPARREHGCRREASRRKARGARVVVDFARRGELQRVDLDARLRGKRDVVSPRRDGVGAEQRPQSGERVAQRVTRAILRLAAPEHLEQGVARYRPRRQREHGQHREMPRPNRRPRSRSHRRPTTSVSCPSVRSRKYRLVNMLTW